MCVQSINSYMGSAFLCFRRSCFDDPQEDQGEDEEAMVAYEGSYDPPRQQDMRGQRLFHPARVGAATSTIADPETDDETEESTSCHAREQREDQRRDIEAQQEDEASGLRRFWLRLSDWGNPKPRYVSVETRGGADVDLGEQTPAGMHLRSPLRTALNFNETKCVPSIATEEIVLPGSDLQKRMAHSMSKSLEEQGDECVICMEGFEASNPRMPTLCGCGENKTYFHLPCLYQWIEQSRNCPSCRKKLRWEEF